MFKVVAGEAEVLTGASAVERAVSLRDSLETVGPRRDGVVEVVGKHLIGVEHIPCTGVVELEVQVGTGAVAGVTAEGDELSGRDGNVEGREVSIGDARLVAVLVTAQGGLDAR